MFVNEMSSLNIEARYPDYKNRIAKSLTNKRCKEIYDNTTQLLQWMKEKIL